MGKHAYLIMAHNDLPLLNALLRTLDDSRNDIFLHLDKKWKLDKGQLYQPNKALLCITRRIKVNWGGDSQIKCEILLLEEATAHGPYEYYHLLSGADLPIKTQEEIHSFFHAHRGRNFIALDNKDRLDEFVDTRIKRYRLFQNMIARKSGKWIAALYYVEQASLRLQQILKVDRTRNSNIIFYKGANWFSITHDLARLVLEQKQLIRKYFSKSQCADEMFLQTIAMNSGLKDTIVNDCLRYTDWTRGNPYTFRMEDLEALKNSDKLFARKFSTECDPDVIEQMVRQF